MKTCFLLRILFYASLVLNTSGARILAILPFAFKSHQFFYQSVLKVLAHRGHEVVVYSPMPLQTPVANYTDVFVRTSLPDDFITYEMVVDGLQHPPFPAMKGWWEFLAPFVEEALHHHNLQKLVTSREKFDVVFTETFAAQEAFIAFGHKFQAYTIAFHSMCSFDFINYVMGNSLATSYIPDWGFPLSDHMTFYERLVNSFSSLLTIYSYYNEILPLQQAIIDRTLKLQNAPSLVEMIHNISMVFLDYHPTINYPRPMMNNLLPLGGNHLSIQRKTLPQDIQKFMDEATDGAIYFSLGTVVPDYELPLGFNERFVRVFGRLKQRVLWKTRAENITGLTGNVKVLKWVPQQDVLGHPNCVLFITHGGLLSQLETMYAGVPVVAIPFLADQPLNVRFYEEKGVGVKLDLFSLSEENIYKAIDTVTSQNHYKQNALRESQIFRDLPKSQADSAVYWVEYVLRHRGAHHLRPASAHMPWYQRILLDVFAAVVIVAVMTVLVVYFLCKTILIYFSNKCKKNNLIKKRN